MQVADIRYKLYIHWPKVILLIVCCLAAGTFDAQAQVYKKTRWVRKNNPNYDNRKLSYGFLIGLHTTALQIKYADRFVTPAFDTVYAVQPQWSVGFSLGFIVNYKVAEYLDLRLTPKVSFYEYKLRYLYTDGPPEDQLIESTMVEFPLLAKYKSARRGNVRMYMIGGFTPGIQASGKKNLEGSTGSLELERFNVNIEGGFGFDLYYPLFKFSPEIRFSRGLMDILGNTTNIYGQPLRSVNTNTITVYLLFQ